MAVIRFKLEGVSGDMLIERTKQVMDRCGLAVAVANTIDSMGGDGEIF